MKKRLISLLVALCMAVTLLPVSAITAWAEESSSNSTTLRIENGYPVGSGGEDWSYDGTTLDLHPASPTEYDFSSLSSDENTLDCALEIGAKATITSGSFTNDITNHGIVSGGTFSPIASVKPCLTFANYGTITDGTFYAPINTPSTSFELSNYPSGTIEGGNFRNSSSNFSFSNQGSINGGIFSTAPNNSIKLGYILKCSGNLNDIFYATCYVIPNTNSTYPTKITASFGFGALSPFDVTINNTQQMLLTEWAGKVESSSDPDRLYVTFTAPPADVDTVTLSKLTRLVIDENGYPVGTKGGTQDYSGDGWNFENGTLTLTSDSYDFSGEKNALRPLNPDVNLVVESGATLAGGAFKNMPTVKGAGTDPFKTVTLNGTDPITAVNGLASGDWGNKLYVVRTGDNTITASKPILDINRYVLESDDFLYPDSSNKSTISLNIEYLENINFIASDEAIVLNQASYDLPLEMANDGTPIINDNAPYDGGGGYYNYYGDGWYVQKSSDGKNLGAYLTGEKTYNFRYTDPVKKTGQLDAVNCSIVNEYGIIEDGIFNTPVANGWPKGDSTKTHEIEGGTFAAGLLYNDGVITGGAFNGKDSVLNKLLGSTVVSDTALSGDYRSVTVNGGAIVKVNDTHPLVYNETTHDLVQGSAWDLYSYAGTVLTVESNVDITNINGQKIGEAFSSIYPNGETDKKVVRFVMPDSDVELNSTKIVDPDPKPEPKPDPTPEAPTYTLTVKGGTFTYNGGEAMTSASVPVDAEVKVTLNQSAVPEGMVFDLWAMDEASLLGNPAVAYNQESFTIPAGSVAKGSTVTVEAQYRDATIESEPSILGTAAIIGVAGAGTAVIVWQGYRIGMELYEKYFQPTPEETAAEQPAPEAPAAAAAS
uniref:hypothetical protein n=1 Tax=Faecalibacterium sp. TaxID=1971605 RepID=UPI003FEFFB2B